MIGNGGECMGVEVLVGKFGKSVFFGGAGSIVSFKGCI